jgi:hypothetical protein
MQHPYRTDQAESSCEPIGLRLRFRSNLPSSSGSTRICDAPDRLMQCNTVSGMSATAVNGHSFKFLPVVRVMVALKTCRFQVSLGGRRKVTQVVGQ